MKTRIAYFISGIALAILAGCILGLVETEFTLKEMFGITLLLTAGAFLSHTFDAEFSSFIDLKENEFFEIRSVVEEKEFFYYQVLQDGEMKHIRDVEQFQPGTYIRSGKKITLRTGH